MCELEKEFSYSDSEIKLRKSRARLIFRLDKKLHIRRVVMNLKSDEVKNVSTLTKLRTRLMLEGNSANKVEAMPSQKVEQNRLLTNQWKIL